MPEDSKIAKDEPKTWVMIKPIDRARRHRNFGVYDLEWIPHTMTFRLGGCFDGERYRSFRATRPLLDLMLSREYRGFRWYAHFGGGSDLAFFLDQFLENDRLQVKGCFSGSSAILVTVKKDKDRWHFIDSYWLLRDSLANIGKSLSMQKGGEALCEVCASLPEKKRAQNCTLCQKKREAWFSSVSLSELRTYNEQDCRILHKAIGRFQDEIWELGGELQTTIASTAMNLFRRVYLKGNINTAQSTNETARHAYIASRVEVIERRMQGGHLYDINSSFPYSMTKPLPGTMMKMGKRLPDKGLYMAELTVRVPEMHLPPLPYRHAKTKKIFFPTGSWRSWFTTPDKEILEQAGGKIEKCHGVMHFESRDDLAGYVLDIYARRQKETDAFRRLVYKYLLNCLYGKFAEQTEKTNLILNPFSPDCPHNGLHPNNSCVEELFPGAILVTENAEVAHAHVPISAFVTAYSRRTIWNYMRPCSKVAYTDTDSIVTHDLLPTSSKLGAMKYEFSFGDGEFIRPKLYRLDRKIKAKGFSRLSYEGFVKIQLGGFVEVQRQMRIREMLRQGKTRPSEYVGAKQLRLEKMTKRHFYKSGSSRPWRVSEIREKLG